MTGLLEVVALPLLDHAALLPRPQNCGTLCHCHFGIQHLHWHHSV